MLVGSIPRRGDPLKLKLDIKWVTRNKFFSGSFEIKDYRVIKSTGISVPFRYQVDT